VTSFVQRGEIIQKKIKGIQIRGVSPRGGYPLLDYVVIDANGLID
jgi:hypothetical protein